MINNNLFEDISEMWLTFAGHIQDFSTIIHMDETNYLNSNTIRTVNFYIVTNIDTNLDLSVNKIALFFRIKRPIR